MTPDDLAAIRTKHERLGALDGSEYGMCLACERDWPCDAVALLAEVDRLIDLLRSLVYTGDEDILSPEAGGRAGLSKEPHPLELWERARIRAAVWELDWWIDYPTDVESIDRAAVLRIIDGRP